MTLRPATIVRHLAGRQVNDTARRSVTSSCRLPQTTVHGGRQSMPLFYEGNSRADFTIDGSQDWTAGGTTLVVYSAAPRTTGPGSSTRRSTARK